MYNENHSLSTSIESLLVPSILYISAGKSLITQTASIYCTEEYFKLPDLSIPGQI